MVLTILRPILAKIILSRNHIRKCKHFPSGLNTAETNDRTLLWSFSAGTFCWVPWQTMRLSVSTFQFCPRTEDDFGSESKISQASLTFLSLGSVTWLHRHFLSVSSIWIHLWWGCLCFLLDFDCFLRGFEIVANVEVLLNRSDETFFVDCIFYHHLVQSKIWTRNTASIAADNPIRFCSRSMVRLEACR